MEIEGWVGTRLAGAPELPDLPQQAAPTAMASDSPLVSFLCLLLLVFPLASAGNYSCPNSRSCGNLTITYPFWLASDLNAIDYSHCGYLHFMLACQDNIPILHYDNYSYRVINIAYHDYTITLADAEVFNHPCPRIRHNFTLLADPALNYTPFDVNITFFFNCTGGPLNNTTIPCFSSTGDSRSYVFGQDKIPSGFDFPRICRDSIFAPVLQANLQDSIDNYEEMLQSGFQLKWSTTGNCGDCESSKGRCGCSRTSNGTLAFSCFCSDGVTEVHKCGGKKRRLKIGIAIGGSAAIVAFLLFSSILFCRYKRKVQYSTSNRTLSTQTSYERPSKDSEKYSVHFQTQIFSYEELLEAANGFDTSNELGDGGFGTVYKGKLQDGRTVAIKRLFEDHRQVKQFMNEIAILSRLHHQNLVNLYGCTSHESKELLLVYEFVPNGTVADHIHGSRASDGILKWPLRLNIAIETADALAYLHAIDPPIVHRDVKTSNILLDSNLHVKVADFGLSRLFPTDVTHVSTAPQGTPGYLDPEYHQCYQLTNKSDVYSFGVVLIELISSKPAVDISRNRKEINLANMAINRIQTGQLDQLVDESLGYQSDLATRKMITMVAEVASKCLQVDGEMRPSIKVVCESLRAIQSEGYRVSKEGNDAVESGDDAGLLNNVGPFSPDIVMNQWVSRSTTPNTSE